MKKISIAILALITVLAACKKVPEVNLEYVDVERDLITVGMTTATVQCDYQYIATLKKAYLYYGEGVEEADMNTAEMRVVQNTLYVDLAGLKANTTYSYYYEFHNGFNSMRTAVKTFKTEASPTTVTLPTVVTASVTEITTNSAKGGGEVTNDGGAAVTERGICWSINTNPTLSDNHVAAGEGTGVFTAAMSDLEAGTVYHVRAYAINEAGTAYGLDREFVTDNGGGCDCGYVDLGLPSGTLWATCNVGANTPEEYGDYFAWGETERKDIYNWETYRYCNGDEFSMTKYCNNSDYGFNGFTDNLTILEADDDIATTSWGGEWCTPTKEQWMELLYGGAGSWMWTSRDGVNGMLFTANNGNNIFFPASGKYDSETGFVNGDNVGHYWSSSLFDDSMPKSAWRFYFTNGDKNVGNEERSQGLSVRPVRKNSSPTPPTPPGNVPEGAVNGLFTINANGDQVYFSQGNLQYQASTNTWRFAEHQWDYVGGTGYSPEYTDQGTVYENGVICDNSLASPYYDGWIDLFGWGTSGFNHGAIAYQPWSFSNETQDYYAYGSPTYNLYDQTGQADWGYNVISNGGNMANIWRTPAAEEWCYLFYERATASNILYAKATVNNIKGVILFPDDWNDDLYQIHNPNSSGIDYSSNVITGSNWLEVFHPFGCVFFPAANYRIKDDIFYGGNEYRGYYWSSSYCKYFIEGYAYSMHFYESDFSVGINDHGGNNRVYGFSVRLIQDVR